MSIDSYKDPVFSWAEDFQNWAEDLEENLDDFFFYHCDGAKCALADKCAVHEGAEAIHFCNKYTNKDIVAYVGERKPIPTLTFVRGISCNLQELVRDNAYDELDDGCDRYCEEVEKVFADDNNSKEFEALVAEWLEKKAGEPSFFKVERVKQVAAIDLLPIEEDDYER